MLCVCGHDVDGCSVLSQAGRSCSRNTQTLMTPSKQLKRAAVAYYRLDYQRLCLLLRLSLTRSPTGPACVRAYRR